MLLNLLLINWTLSMIFCLMTHPLSLGLILLMQTILVSLITGFIIMNYWYSYILFLVMVGGMLVLFIYMTSIASNEKFKFNKFIVLICLIMMILLLSSKFIDTYFPQIIKFYNENFDLFNESHKFSMNKYMNYPNICLMILIILYLLITLIAIVKITNLSSGPLRQKF